MPILNRGWVLRIFRDGMIAGKAGAPSQANPYPPDSDQAAVWVGGWVEGGSLRSEALGAGARNGR